jgi:serine/threonine-protein kinase
VSQIDRVTSALAGRYRIERELGHGGMATVYLARDLRHERDVAIKVLHPELGAALGGDRFLSEIRTTARLQHPHILPLLDSGDADALLYYVMPLATGETLRDRLTREKQLPIDDALRIAREVADALGHAHGQGIIHRDIKPENILLQGGHALVADFGIALAVAQAGGQRMTQTGLSLGTPQYMSPEQAMGERTIDARSDIYALGAVTYEMLAGEPPFSGPTVQSIVAKVLADTPRPLTELRRSVPVHVQAAVQSALEKLPADRLASATAFADALGNASFGRGGGSGSISRPRVASGVPRRSLIAAAALNLLLLAVALALWLRPGPVSGTSRQQVVLWRYTWPPLLEPGVPTVVSQAAIAPDGSSIVYSDSTSAGVRLMRKPRDATDAVPLAGTEGGVSPFFSPDGRWVGFLTLDGKVRKVPVAGGGAITLAEDGGQDYKVGAWLDDETIVYSDARQWLTRIAADGASGTRVISAKPVSSAAVASLWPLPGSRGFLFTYCKGNCSVNSGVYVYDIGSDSARELVPRAAGGWYSPTGHLLYTGREGGLFAAPFDLDGLEIRSSAVPVIDGVVPGRFTLSASGTVLYSIDAASGAGSEVVWVGRDGRVTPLDSTWRGGFEYPALSPDGTALAVSLRGATTDLWIRRADGTKQKVIAEGAANWRASWMPDGQSLVFVSIRQPESNAEDVAIYRIRADGSTGAELLHRQKYGVWEGELSRDGEWLVVRSDEHEGNSNVYARRLRGDTTLMPLLVDPQQTLTLALSPDSRWLAYGSNESGLYEIYVASFPDMKAKRLVSRGGGTEPRWSRSGRELFFRSGTQLMAVDVPLGASFSPGNPRPLFTVTGFRQARNRQQYDVAPDGRFVMIRESVPTGAGVVYAEHWFPELRATLGR